MPLIGTRGAASAQGFGEFAQQTAANYIEDVFSTYLYTGNGSTQTITNGIDLAGKGGLFWVKARAVAGSNGLMYGSGTELCSNSTNGLPASQPYTFGASGITFTGGIWTGFSSPNESGRIYTSWTFRKQAKFFDIVTYTGNGVARTIAHNLGSVPGCMIIKRLDDASNWPVYHRSNLADDAMFLNAPDSINPSKTYWNNTRPTSTVFSLGSDAVVNTNGGTYVAYLFAHDAGGFGLNGTDNVISCGSWTDSGSGTQTITLGYEPQFLIYKRTDNTSNWVTLDNMRGWPVVNAAGSTANLYPNLSNAESGGNYAGNGPTATGFTMPTLGGGTYIYIAIRRGPMKTPTSGTSVFTPTTATGDNGNVSVSTVGFQPDFIFSSVVGGTYGGNNVYTNRITTRLIGYGTLASDSSPTIQTNSTSAEATYNYAVWRGDGSGFYTNTGWVASKFATWFFQRAPGYMDVVCYTGTGSATTQAHNLGVAPEMMIVKSRSSGVSWWVYAAPNGNTKYQMLNNTSATTTSSTAWNNTSPTASVFTVGTASEVNASGQTYVAYLFASCPGVSKVGSYSGTGATQTISCGFAARFVMIKRTDSTGDWWGWDTARGMVAGTDPRLPFNSSSAETNANWVYTDASGFQIVTTDATVNASGGSYIFLAIA